MSQTALARPAPPCCPASPGSGGTGTPCSSGSDPGPAVLLEVADPRAAHLLDLLDGTRSERDGAGARGHRPGHRRRRAYPARRPAQRPGLLVPAHSLLPGRPDRPGPGPARRGGRRAGPGARPGCPAPPPQVLRRRRAARVRAHRRRALLGGPLAVALAQAGVGQVIPHLDRPGTPGRPGRHRHHRHRAGPSAGRRRSGPRSIGPRRAPAPTGAGPPGCDLVIQLGTDRPPALLAAGSRPAPAAAPAGHPARGRTGRRPAGPPAAPAPACTASTCTGPTATRPGRGSPPSSPRPTPAAAVATGTAAQRPSGYAAGRGADPARRRPARRRSAAPWRSPAAGRFRRRGWPPHPACDCSRGG